MEVPHKMDSNANPEDVQKEQQLVFCFQSFQNVIFHPVEYVKVLCQLGHEPIAPRAGRNIFGQPRLILPNVFQYIKYIKQRDGFFGCFNGLLPSFCGNIVSAFLPVRIMKSLDLSYMLEDPPNIINDDDVQSEEYIKYGCREMTVHTISIIVSYPFRVVSIRMMASFVGGEVGYRTMFRAFSSIYRENGLSGFYNGIVPNLIGSLTCIGTSIAISYYVNKYFVKNSEGRRYVIPTCMFVVSTVLYPFTVTSTCMAVSGSGLAAGNPPKMPIYKTWQDCLRDLISRKQHKRGSSLIFRYQS